MDINVTLTIPDDELTFTLGQLAHYRDRIYDVLEQHDGALPPDTMGLVKGYMSANRRLTMLAKAHLGELLITATGIRAAQDPARPGCSASRDLFRALSGGDAVTADLT